MISSEVQRTLVKSPPELWAELSDQDSLSRHLGALGDIRITRAEPEKLVEWETARTSGVVQIKPSGWGTKVTLSVSREIELAEQPDAEDPASNAESVGETPEPGPVALASSEQESATEPEAETESEAETAPEPSAEAAPTDAAPQLEAPATKPQRGLFARLFSRRRPRGVQEEPSPSEKIGSESSVATSPPEPEKAKFPAPPTDDEPQDMPVGSAIEQLQARFAPAEPEPEATAAEAPGEAPADLAAELRAAEEIAAEEVTAVLTAVLDRLGAAHHRPFSRS
jgi:hypothetical protein